MPYVPPHMRNKQKSGGNSSSNAPPSNQGGNNQRSGNNNNNNNNRRNFNQGGGGGGGADSNYGGSSNNNRGGNNSNNESGTNNSINHNNKDDDDTRDWVDKARDKAEQVVSGVKGAVEGGFAALALYDLGTDIIAAYYFFNPQKAGTCVVDDTTGLYYYPLGYNPVVGDGFANASLTNITFDGETHTCAWSTQLFKSQCSRFLNRAQGLAKEHDFRMQFVFSHSLMK